MLPGYGGGPAPQQQQQQMIAATSNPSTQYSSDPAEALVQYQQAMMVYQQQYAQAVQQHIARQQQQVAAAQAYAAVQQQQQQQQQAQLLLPPVPPQRQFLQQEQSRSGGVPVRVYQPSPSTSHIITAAPQPSPSRSSYQQQQQYPTVAQTQQKQQQYPTVAQAPPQKQQQPACYASRPLRGGPPVPQQQQQPSGQYLPAPPASQPSMSYQPPVQSVPVETYTPYRSGTTMEVSTTTTNLDAIPTVEYRRRSSVVPVIPQQLSEGKIEHKKGKGGRGGGKNKKKGKFNANQTPLGPRKVTEGKADVPSNRQQLEPLGELRVPSPEERGAKKPETAVRKAEEGPKLDQKAMADMYKQAMTQSDVPQWKLKIDNKDNVVDLTGEKKKPPPVPQKGGGKGAAPKRKAYPKFPSHQQPPPPPPPPPLGGEDMGNWTEKGQWKGPTKMALTHFEYSEEMKDVLPPLRAHETEQVIQLTHDTRSRFPPQSAMMLGQQIWDPDRQIRHRLQIYPRGYFYAGTGQASSAQDTWLAVNILAEEDGGSPGQLWLKNPNGLKRQVMLWIPNLKCPSSSIIRYGPTTFTQQQPTVGWTGLLDLQGDLDQLIQAGWVDTNGRLLLRSMVVNTEKDMIVNVSFTSSWLKTKQEVVESKLAAIRFEEDDLNREAELAREAARAQALAGTKTNNGKSEVSTESAIRLVGPEAWTSSTARVPTTPLKSATEWRLEGKGTPQTAPPSKGNGWDTTEKEAESNPWTAPKGGGSDKGEMKTDSWGERLRHSAEEKQQSWEGNDDRWTGWWYDWKWDDLKKEWYKEWRKEGDCDGNEDDDDGWEDGEPVAAYSFYEPDGDDNRHFEGHGDLMDPTRHDRLNSGPERYWPREPSMLPSEPWEQPPSQGPWMEPSWEDQDEHPAFSHYSTGVDAMRRMPSRPREGEWLPITEPVEEEMNYPLRRPVRPAKGKGRRRRRSKPFRTEEIEHTKRMRRSSSRSPRRDSLDRSPPAVQSITYDRPAGHDFDYYAARR